LLGCVYTRYSFWFDTSYHPVGVKH
jgi:hypothetical protein